MLLRVKEIQVSNTGLIKPSVSVLSGLSRGRCVASDASKNDSVIHWT